MTETSTGWPAARSLAPDFTRARSLILGSAAGIPIVATVASADRWNHIVLCPFCGLTHAHGGWGPTSRRGVIDGQARFAHCHNYGDADGRSESLFGDDRQPYYVLREVPGTASFHEDPDAGRTFWKMKPNRQGVADASVGLRALVRGYEDKWAARIERDGNYITLAEVNAKTQPPAATPRGGARVIPKRNVPAAVERDVLAAANCCYYCHDAVMPRQVEHFRPLARGGTNERSNLVAACISCNHQKKTMLVHEWRQWRESNGMSWPPVATHATELRHYLDVCERCDLANGLTVGPDHHFMTLPTSLELESPGNWYTGHYRCPVGHQWTCGWGIDTNYHSDCPCSWCVAKRAENGDKTYPPSTVYEDAA